MSRLIVEFGNKFLEWCPKAEAPVTKLMGKAELYDYVRREHGDMGLSELPSKLERVSRQGTSSIIGITKRTLLLANRAGEAGRCLTTEAEMVARHSG